jgi:two-component system sensor histidine kinase KdpD
LTVNGLANPIDSVAQTTANQDGALPDRSSDQSLDGVPAPFVVAVSASARAAQLVLRAAARVTAGERWFAVHIETATDSRMNREEHALLAANLGLAEQLGAETVILPAVDPVGELLRFARRHGATQILVGKPRHPRWNSWLGRLSVDKLARRSDQIDICILSDGAPRAVERPTKVKPDQRQLLKYFSAAGLVSLCTLFNMLAIQPYLPLRNVVMIYLLGVIVVARYLGRGPSALAAVLSVATFDLVFISPLGSATQSTTIDAITFGVMLSIGLTISTLTGHLSFQVQAAREREQRMSALFAMSREFATLRSCEEIALAAERRIGDAVGAEATVRLVDEPDHLPEAARDRQPGRWTTAEQGIVDWVIRHNERAGMGTSNHAEATAVYLPLSAAHGCLGVLRVRLAQVGDQLSSEQWDLLKTLTSVTAMAIERARWVDAAERARLDTEAERLRNSLLSAVSHDLRTPLAAIVGSSSTLVELGEKLGPEVRHEMAEAILDEGERLNRQVANLLDMTRLGNGSMVAHKEWQPVEEVIGVVLSRLHRLLKGFPVETRLGPGLPPVPLDHGLIQQVLVNLVENAIKYSPPGTPITLSVWRDQEGVVVEVADRGPGIPTADLERAFTRFYRVPAVSDRTGAGLGLTICKGILKLHDGWIRAQNRSDGGLAVQFLLPLPHSYRNGRDGRRVRREAALESQAELKPDPCPLNHPS